MDYFDLGKYMPKFPAWPTAAMGTTEDIVVGIVYDASDVVGAYLRG
jgi:hypothetical protein